VTSRACPSSNATSARSRPGWLSLSWCSSSDAHTPGRRDGVAQPHQAPPVSLGATSRRRQVARLLGELAATSDAPRAATFAAATSRAAATFSSGPSAASARCRAALLRIFDDPREAHDGDPSSRPADFLRKAPTRRVDG
jgi:hypothetical protein